MYNVDCKPLLVYYHQIQIQTITSILSKWQKEKANKLRTQKYLLELSGAMACLNPGTWRPRREPRSASDLKPEESWVWN